MNYYLDPILKHYTDFSGRATRKQFWLFTLIDIIILIVLTVFDFVLGMYSMEEGIGILGAIYCLATLVPDLAIQIRRLRDAGFNIWLWFLVLIPFIGIVILIVLWCMPSKYDKSINE